MTEETDITEDNVVKCLDKLDSVFAECHDEFGCFALLEAVHIVLGAMAHDSGNPSGFLLKCIERLLQAYQESCPHHVPPPEEPKKTKKRTKPRKKKA